MSYKTLKFQDKNAASRFRAVCEKLFPSVTTNVALAEKLGSTEGAVRKWLKDGSLPGVLVKLLVSYGASEDYILLGKGDILVPTPIAPAGIPLASAIQIETRVLEREWPVRGLAAADDSGGRLAPMEDDFKEPVTPPPGLLLVPVQGDSMSPVVLPGQYVAIDQEREGFEVDGGIVVAYIEDPPGEDERRESMIGTFVKRCYRGDGVLYFASVNDYPPFSAWEDHCRIWPVIGVWFAGKGKPPVEG